MSVETEIRAMSAALACLQGGDREETLTLVRAALPMEKPSSVEDLVTQAAMRVILGQPVEPPTFEPAKRPSDRHLFEVTSRGWLVWASQGDRKETLRGLQALSVPSGKGALHLMALRPWKAAVEALLREEPLESRMLFWRASEMGAQFGTESNPVVQWTYAASFFSSCATVIAL